ncbi:sugar transferase [Candidatus Merdisoma sp. JLR.KK011]|uniref:sugar transferase n=1 Tax=Candidatus Merdisoma sp. JLR.KK011 TaxID=3114299 RepID=UPI002FF3E5A3
MSNLNQKQRIIQNYTILGVECLCITVSFVLAVFTRGVSASYRLYSETYISTIICILFFHLLSSYLFDWNTAFFQRGYFVEFIAVLKYNSVLILFLSLFLFIAKFAEDFSRLIFFYFFIYNVLLTYLCHLLVKQYFIRIYRNSSSSNKLIVITTNNYMEKILEKLLSAKEWSFEIAGLVILDKELTGTSVWNIPVIASSSNLYDVFTTVVVDEVFLHLPDYSKEELEKLIQQFESMGITVHVNIDYFDNVAAHKTTEIFAGFTVLSYESNSFDYRRLFIKRGMDILGSFIGCIITILITPFAACAIKLESPGPVFFSQLRVGKNGRNFKIYKFRSMYIDAEDKKKELMAKNEMSGPLFKMEHDPRITKVGAFLRKTSIDELPQFFNILLGQMSLVGTRPPTLDEFKQYELYFRRRLSIKPGLTGLWQVSGRSDITDFQEILRLDLEYIDSWSLSTDIKILFLTVWVVIMGKGAK